MGARKRLAAEARKEALKTQFFAKLNSVPTSPRKMRLVADNITIRQLESLTADKYSIDISPLADDYEKMCYCDEVASAKKIKIHFNIYKKFYKALRKKKTK